MSRSFKLAVLPGDGIGPEVMAEALKVLDTVATRSSLTFELQPPSSSAVLPSTPWARPSPLKTVAACEASDAILFGSVGGPKWEHLPPNEQPERGALLPLSKHFGLFANLRPGICHPALTSSSSPIRPDLVEGGFDVLCVRELTGGMYFGQPKSRTTLPDGDIEVIDTMVYKKSEIVRIAHVAFKAAQLRRKHVTSVDKANVLTNSVLWRETMVEVAKEYPDVTLAHLYVDNAAMQLIKAPRSFDVLVTENLFGDILSDEMAMICGSLGMLASASLGKPKGDGLYFGLFEPSAAAPPPTSPAWASPTPSPRSSPSPCCCASPSASNKKPSRSKPPSKKSSIDGLRTGDIFSGAPGTKKVNTKEIGEAIIAAL
jgi:3-isopropylmalate dehydrogenase